MAAREINFDGLVGPTHNYAGLSFGNLASAKHRNLTSYPRQAALQGLEKMRVMKKLGLHQAVLPPMPRPGLSFLRSMGCCGRTASELVESAWKDTPELVAIAFSAANMWTANAATVSPSVDSVDRRTHISPANLASTLHRSQEAEFTTMILRQVFPGDRFLVHDPLFSNVPLADEGAANHTRLTASHDQAGLELFVYGADASDLQSSHPTRFPARQTKLASQAIARRHRLDPSKTFFWQQSPQAIDAGVFHNDVISVGNENVLLCHERAFVDQSSCLSTLKEVFQRTFGNDLILVELSEQELPLEDAVASYLFNSQLVTRPDGKMTLICPSDCEKVASAKRAIQKILAESNPVDQAIFIDLRQSMNNGGGPACLRLRVVVQDDELDQIHSPMFLSDELDRLLVDWIERRYREELKPDDLRDPQLIQEVEDAMLELSSIFILNGLDRLHDF